MLPAGGAREIKLLLSAAACAPPCTIACAAVFVYVDTGVAGAAPLLLKCPALTPASPLFRRDGKLLMTPPVRVGTCRAPARP